jgi:hypothetical protein
MSKDVRDRPSRQRRRPSHRAVVEGLDGGFDPPLRPGHPPEILGRGTEVVHAPTLGYP